ncbi:MAG: secondary thiamine-phosphate synthase enzyme YjbQ [Deltaproteobacteria bacterium]|nr:secondary thiamine-phosphate synthase enzyme YjbQ [Deltaproteobacteria bacterium]
MKTVTIRTAKRQEMIDVTGRLREFLQEEGLADGAVIAFTPHTTAAVTINENADPDVRHDMLLGLAEISPDRRAFKHGEGNSDAHIKSSLVGCSELILVEEGRPILGTWQGLYFCEFDGPRNRKLIFKKV